MTPRPPKNERTPINDPVLLKFLSIIEFLKISKIAIQKGMRNIIRRKNDPENIREEV
jgi:hypothetical protein